jgi:hypothetical protein
MTIDKSEPRDPAAPERAAQEPAPRKPLSDVARRALAEAEARQAELRAREAAMPKELGGRGGRDPVRYGDWESKGRASDF